MSEQEVRLYSNSRERQHIEDCASTLRVQLLRTHSNSVFYAMSSDAEGTALQARARAVAPL